MKKLAALFLVLSILVVGSGAALAWAPQLQGQPYQFQPGDSNGVFIWRDHDGVHLRTTTHGREHLFSGQIRTEGRFVDVRRVGNERNDFSHMSGDRDTLSFRFHTAGGTDGLDFRVKGSDRLSFELYMDGHRIDTSKIYVGSRGWHPGESEFELR